MPKAGFEPARLAAPPPQDGVSASSTTSARSRGLKPAATLLLLRCVGRCRSWSRSALLLLRLGRRLLSRLLLLLLLLVLSRSFANDGGAVRLQIQNRQRQRRNHKQDSRDGRSFAQECAGAASAERCLTAAATEGSCPIRAGALLQQNDDDQKNAN